MVCIPEECFTTKTRSKTSLQFLWTEEGLGFLLEFWRLHSLWDEGEIRAIVPTWNSWHICWTQGKGLLAAVLVNTSQRGNLESDDYALELAMAHEWFSPTILRGVDNCREAVSFCPFLGCRNVNCKYKCDRNVGCKFCIIVEAWTFGWIIIYLYTPTVRSWRCQWLVEFYANCFYI